MRCIFLVNSADFMASLQVNTAKTQLGKKRPNKTLRHPLFLIYLGGGVLQLLEYYA
ncbi:hypothetical protein D3C73_934220 [compost metagenome]